MATGLRYEKLSSDREEIRLLYFPKGGCKVDERLECTIKTVSLLDKAPPQYIAVSYTWGDASNRAEIEINGELANVPRNAEVALRCLHHQSVTDKQDEPSGFWLDAICINQTDVTEKNHQISLMVEVYSQAREVFVWLGEAQRLLAASVATMVQELAKECSGSGSMDMIELSQHGESSFEQPGPLDLAALDALFSSPWFGRLWVVQEVLLAKRATCFLGPISVPLPDIVMVSTYLLASERRNYSSRTLDTAMRQASLLQDLKEKESTISDLLLLSLERRATLLHDKIYGILGLIAPWTLPKPDTRLSTLPSLGLSLKDLYSRVTRAAIEQGDIRIIQYADATCAEDSQEAWPSWVPRYDRSPRYPAVPTLRSRLIEVRPPIADGSDTLMIRGVVVDVVEELGPTFEYVVEFGVQDPFFGFLRALNACRSLLVDSATVEYSESQELTLGETLTMRRLSSLVDDASDMSLAITSLQKLWRVCEKYRDTMMGEVSQEDVEIATSWYKAVGHSNFGRKFAITQQGRLAMVSPQAQKGDKVCIFPDSFVPFLLRAEGENWRMLGDAYVHGVMKGKYLQELVEAGLLDREKVWFGIK